MTGKMNVKKTLLAASLLSLTTISFAEIPEWKAVKYNGGLEARVSGLPSKTGRNEV